MESFWFWFFAWVIGAAVSALLIMAMSYLVDRRLAAEPDQLKSPNQPSTAPQTKEKHPYTVRNLLEDVALVLIIALGYLALWPLVFLFIMLMYYDGLVSRRLRRQS